MSVGKALIMLMGTGSLYSVPQSMSGSELQSGIAGGPGVAGIGLSMSRDGSWSIATEASGVVESGFWVSPLSPTVGDEFEVKVVSVAPYGLPSGSPTETWVRVDTTLGWAVSIISDGTPASNGEASVSFQVQFRRYLTETTLATAGDYIFTVTVFNT